MAKSPATAAAAKTATTTRKLRLWEIVEIYQTLSNPGAVKFPIPLVAFRVALNRNRLKEFVTVYDEKTQEIQEKFTKKDAAGRNLKKTHLLDGVEVELDEWDSDDMEGWNKAKRDLNNDEHDVGFSTFSLQLLDKVKDVDQRFMNALVYMIEEG